MFNFAKFNKKTVRFDNGDGTEFESTMLPMEKLPEYKVIVETLDAESNLQKRLECRERLIALAQTVFPADKAPYLERCDLNDAVNIATYLMYGWGDDDDGKKKAEETATE